MVLGTEIKERELLIKLDEVLGHNQRDLTHIIKKDRERKVFEEYRTNMVSKLVEEIKVSLQDNKNTNKNTEEWVSRLNTMSISNLIDDHSYEELHYIIKQLKNINIEGE